MTAEISAQDRTFDFKIGQRTRKIRLDAGLTMVDAAEVLGISFSQISRKEYGQNPYTSAELVRLAKLYKTTVEKFFRGLKI